MEFYVVSVLLISIIISVSATGNNIIYDSLFCDRYSASTTSNAISGNLQYCDFDKLIPNGIPPGTIVRISDCSRSCVGDQFIRLYLDGAEVAANNDGK